MIQLHLIISDKTYLKIFYYPYFLASTSEDINQKQIWLLSLSKLSFHFTVMSVGMFWIVTVPGILPNYHSKVIRRVAKIIAVPKIPYKKFVAFESHHTRRVNTWYHQDIFIFKELLPSPVRTVLLRVCDLAKITKVDTVLAPTCTIVSC